MIGRGQTPPAGSEAKPRGFDDFELRLGDVMRGERATLGKSLLDVQRDLRIRASYIAAIENADPEAFETPGFIAGYVRSYARYLGLDPEWAYAQFCRESGFSTAHGMSPAASANRPPGPARSARRAEDPLADPNALFIPRGRSFWAGLEPGALGSLLVLLMLISAIGYGGWSVFRAVQRVELAPVEQAPGVGTEIVALVSAPPEREEDPSGVPAVKPDPEALDRLYRPQALDLPVLEPRDPPIATLDPMAVGSFPPLRGVAAGRTRGSDLLRPGSGRRAGAGETAAPEVAVPVRVVAEEEPEVALHALRPTWVRVRAADGTVLLEKILDAGEHYVVPRREAPPVLRAGNAGALYFVVNGVYYGPAGTGPSVVKNVVLSPAALAEAYARADPEADTALERFLAEAGGGPEAGGGR